MNLSRELRVTFGALPSRLLVAGGEPDGIEFSGPPDPVVLEAQRKSREESLRRDAEENARNLAIDRDRKFDASVAAISVLARDVRAELEAELIAVEPELAKLAFRVAERALRRSLVADPMLLAPAIEDAMKRLRAGLDEPSLVTLVVGADAAERFTAAFSADSGAPVRVVTDAAFEPGRFEVRCDIRRVRHSVSRELETVATLLSTEGDKV